MSDFLTELLRKRKNNAYGGYVFASDRGDGHLYEPRYFMRKVTKASGVNFTLHDLRRTFITVAESLDISAYALKRLLNHKMQNDVTAGYIISDVERLRAPMQRITDLMLRTLEYARNGEVVTFESLHSQTPPPHSDSSVQLTPYTQTEAT